MKTRLLIDGQSKPCKPTFIALQKGEVVAYCLGEGLTCTAAAQRLGIPVSSLAKWVVTLSPINRGELSDSGQAQLPEERAELMQLRRENRELRREKVFRHAAAHYLKY